MLEVHCILSISTKEIDERRISELITISMSWLRVIERYSIGWRECLVLRIR